VAGCFLIGWFRIDVVCGFWTCQGVSVVGPDGKKYKFTDAELEEKKAKIVAGHYQALEEKKAQDAAPAPVAVNTASSATSPKAGERKKASKKPTGAPPAKSASRIGKK
jgi:hypothetical protein